MTETVTTPADAVLPFTPTLDGLLAWAEAEHEKQLQGLPSEWDQGHWAISRPDGTPIAASCATACCLAGKTVAADGGKFLLKTPSYGEFGIATDAELPTGEIVDVENYATERLGLTYEQAQRLFDVDNDIQDVRDIIAAIQSGDTEFFDNDEDDDICPCCR